ncbi:MAG TPA: acyltransferase family protein [Miltoncostaeaceae bacterium]|nr:acyltransferase family protein [Miltoncostaeaceae bacterium]
MADGTHTNRRSGRIPFRTDIEGLRGIATITVVAYHAGVPFLSGGYIGLDIFFVMSGFLITALLVREVDATGTIALREFFARRIRRLLPAAVTVLGFILVAAGVLMAPLGRARVAGDVLAANLYVVNWRFAEQQTDYLSAGLSASPVQHFWSLSAEEQFYLVWPLLMLAGVMGAVRLHVAPRVVVGLLLGLLALMLFVHSVHHTRTSAGAAYFSTLARGWEFAIGAGLALIPTSHLRIPRPVASALVCVGGAALVWTALTFDETTRFPGPGALIPCAASAAIIAAGIHHPDTLPARLLTVRPARWVGRISYSWYLWHWPLLVFAALAWGKLPLGATLAIVAAALIPTVLTHRLIEEPFRRAHVFARSPSRSFRLGLTCTALVVVGVFGSLAAIPGTPLASAEEAIGARALARPGARLQENADAIRPNPISAIRYRGRADADGCLVRPLDTRSETCIYGRLNGARTVVLFGDSHAMQWFPALAAVARHRGWRLLVLTKAGCTPADVPIRNAQLRRRYEECEDWRGWALARIARARPSAVVVGNAGGHHVLSGSDTLERAAAVPVMTRGLVRTLRRLRSGGARVWIMRENPRPPLDVRACVSRSLRGLGRCAFSRLDGYSVPSANTRAARAVRGVELIDSRPVLCPATRCPAVIGNVLVYRNTSHLTATYVATLTDWLSRRLPARVPAARPGR